jgi:hypothetical protein
LTADECGKRAVDEEDLAVTFQIRQFGESFFQVRQSQIRNALAKVVWKIIIFKEIRLKPLIYSALNLQLQLKAI